jgi:hypothetical protein
VRLKILPLSGLLVFLALAISNLVSTVALCGAGLCPESPTQYLLFDSTPV